MTRELLTCGYHVPRRLTITALLPIGALATTAIVRLLVTRFAGVGPLAVCLGSLFMITLMSASYSCRRFPALHLLPFVWSVLMVLELVVSPSLDILTGTFPLASPRFVDSMTTAS